MKVSIITSTYNSAATLRDTLESVLAQTYTDWEHIIIDGASTDATLDIVKAYEPHYGGRLRWVSEPDRGIYDAMNKGIARATGDVVGLLNSDDFYTSPEVLAQLIEPIARGEADAVYGNVQYVERDNTQRRVRYYSSASFRRWKMRFGFMPAHPTFYCRREVYDRHGMFDTDFRIAADFEHLLRVLYIGRTAAAFVPCDCVTMRTGGASTAGMKAHWHIMRDHARAYHKNGVLSNRFLDALRYPAKIIDLMRGSLR